MLQNIFTVLYGGWGAVTNVASQSYTSISAESVAFYAGHAEFSRVVSELLRDIVQFGDVHQDEDTNADSIDDNGWHDVTTRLEYEKWKKSTEGQTSEDGGSVPSENDNKWGFELQREVDEKAQAYADEAEGETIEDEYGEQIHAR